MKKIAIGLVTAFLLLVVGTATFAQEDSTDIFNFEKMKPYMEKMHPSFSDEQLKDMYESCHGENGMMRNANFNDMQKRMNGGL